MLKNHHKELTIAHKLIDLIIVFAAWGLSYFLRFESGIPAQVGLEVWYLKYGLLLVAINYYYFRREGLYTSKRLEPLLKEIMSVVRANTMAFIVFIIITYFMSTLKVSRGMLLAYYLTSTSLLILFKICVRRFLRYLRANGKNLRNMVFIGSGNQLKDYVAKIKNNPELGIVPVGWIDSKGNSEIFDIKGFDNFSKQLLKELGVDVAVIGYATKDTSKLDLVFSELSNSTIETIYLPDLSHSLIGYSITTFNSQPMIIINEPNIKSRSIIAKRVFDIVFSSIGLIALSPILILIAVLVKLTSAGPIFYSQIRMGLDGKKFKMFKFRTMRVGENNENGWTTANDPRVTSIGKFLRKTSLDELPQLWNVFIGEMSLVGPRPERPMYVEKFQESIPTYMLRHKMKAGITGWAQINGWRGDTCIQKRIECDLYYIKNWSIWMDVTIIVMTFWKGFINKNAY